MEITFETIDGTIPNEFTKPIIELAQIVDGNDRYEVKLIIKDKRLIEIKNKKEKAENER